MNDFFRFIRLNIIKTKNAYLHTQLVSDWKNMCDGRGVSSVITHTYQIRKRIEEEFPNDINFFPSGRNVIVQNATMNPRRYSVATLQGAGLRDLDISKVFAAMVRRKMELTKKASDFPYTPEGLIENLNKGPLPDLYNVIYLTINDTCSLNEHGYAVTTSKNLASKIWSTAYDWEALITGQKIQNKF